MWDFNRMIGKWVLLGKVGDIGLIFVFTGVKGAEKAGKKRGLCLLFGYSIG
jgi:hypothetical protein